MENNKNSSNTSTLRQKATEQLEKLNLKSNLKQSGFDLLRLNQELQIHQIELEMQNDELMQSKEQTELISSKYKDLYNLAPVGYFTLTNYGEIVELNLYGSNMLGKISIHLINSLFGFFVTEEDKPTYNSFLEKIFVLKKNETCMVTIVLDDNITKDLLLTGKISKNAEQCLIGAIDVTLLNRTEKKAKELKQFNSYFVGRELKMIELKKEINELRQNAGLPKEYLQ